MNKLFIHNPKIKMIYKKFDDNFSAVHQKNFKKIKLHFIKMSVPRSRSFLFLQHF